MTLMRETISGATRALGLQHLAQHAVDAEADDEAVLERLDVDVGRVVLDRLRQDRVDQLDDRRLVVAFEQVGGFGQVLREVGEVGVVLEPPTICMAVLGAAFVVLAQQLIERFGVDASQLQRHAEHAAHFGDRSRAARRRDSTASAMSSPISATSTPWRLQNANDSGRGRARHAAGGGEA